MGDRVSDDDYGPRRKPVIVHCLALLSGCLQAFDQDNGAVVGSHVWGLVFQWVWFTRARVSPLLLLPLENLR